METVGEILQAIQDKQSDKLRLDARMEADFNLLALEPYEPDNTGYESYTSSAPRNYYDKISDGVNRAQLTIQIKLAEDATEAQRRAASVGELYLFGALNTIDRRLRKRGDQPLREILGFHIEVRGWYGLRVLVYVPDGEKDTVFDVKVWDVMHAAWEEGEQGLLWGAYQEERTKAQIEAAYPGHIITGKTAIVTDFWDTEVNGVIIGDSEPWGKPLKEHGIGHVPVLIGKVGPMPAIIRQNNSESTLHLQGDSIWTASRNLYAPQNKYISWIMDRAKASVAGSLIHESKDGTKSFGSDPYQTFQEIKISTDAGERIYPLALPETPAEMAAVTQIIGGDIERSTLPDPTSYGGVHEVLSGVALSVLADSTRSQYSPRTGALSVIYTWLCEELLYQFENLTVNGRKVRKVAELSGYNPKEEFFTVKVKPQNIDKAWYVEVMVEPRLPRDLDQEISQALRVTTPRGPNGKPLLSDETALEQFLRLRDPDAEGDKILAQMAETLEPIRIAMLAAALKRRGDDEKADLVLALLAGEGGETPPTNEATPAGGAQSGLAPIPPEIMEAVVASLLAAGQEDLAEALFVTQGGQVGPTGSPTV